MPKEYRDEETLMGPCADADFLLYLPASTGEVCGELIYHEEVMRVLEAELYLAHVSVSLSMGSEIRFADDRLFFASIKTETQNVLAC